MAPLLVPIDETNIALDVDKAYKFKYPDSGANDPKTYSWLNITNEHVMVWYQMESFPIFYKLWGHINQTMKAGVNYTLTIANNFNITQFEGKKYVYLSEVNMLGGNNKFLGLVYIIAAGVIVFMMLIFCVLYCIRIYDKDLYSTENLQW